MSNFLLGYRWRILLVVCLVIMMGLIWGGIGLLIYWLGSTFGALLGWGLAALYAGGVLFNVAKGIGPMADAWDSVRQIDRESVLKAHFKNRVRDSKPIVLGKDDYTVVTERPLREKVRPNE